MERSYGTEEQLISAVQEINAHATKEEYRYKHFYSPGDIFCWDNYQTLHRGPADLVGVAALGHSHARFLHRISVKGVPKWELPRGDPEEWRSTHVAGGYMTPAETVSIV